MPDLDLPVPHDDRDVWGPKLNGAIEVLNVAVDAAVVDAEAAASSAATAASDAANAAADAATAASVADDAATAVAAVVPRTETRAVGQGELVVNAADYGALGNGVADDHTAIQAALDAAGGIVMLPPGDFLLGSGKTLNIPEGVTLAGHGIGVTRILRGGAGSNLVNMTGGSLGAQQTTLTADAEVGDATLTVVSTTGITAGDWFLLTDDSVPDPAYVDRYSGELVQVHSVTSGTTLVLRSTSPGADHAAERAVSGTFDDAALDGVGSYKVSADARLMAITLADGTGLRDLSLVNPTPESGNGMGLNAGFTLNATISSVEIAGIDGTGINLGYAVGTVITACRIHDLVDDPPEGRYGYGISIAGASQDIVISNCSFDRLRHGVTTNGHTSGGIARRITVADCRSYQAHETAFDTHGAGLDITFSNCVAVEPATQAFTVRARRVTLQGCQAIRPGGIAFNVGQLPARRVIIDSCTVIDGGATAVRVRGVGIVDVFISNLTVDGCMEHGVSLGYGNTRQVVTNSRFFNIGQAGDTGYYGVTLVADSLGTVDAPGTLVASNLFVKNKTYGVATNYNAAVRIGNAAVNGAVVMSNRATGIYTGATGFILDSGTGTVLWDNARPEVSNMGTNNATATTTQLNSVTSLINLTKRRGTVVYNTTTGTPVWAAADGAAGVWTDATGATVHTPV